MIGDIYRPNGDLDLYKGDGILESVSELREPRLYVIKEKEEKVIERTIPLKKKEFTNPLRILSSKVLGNLFLRTSFLRQRIRDLEDALEKRIQIHNKLMTEIDKDIEEKQRRAMSAGDINLIRELELDITNLKMERRKEMLTFWKDVLEIKRELQELREQYTIESKILEVFKEDVYGNAE